MSPKSSTVEFDEIGYWSEIKLAILDEYARPYNQILHSKSLHTAYIDAFAGAGHHVTKLTGALVKGSPVRAMEVQPPFDFLHFVDMDDTRVDELSRLSAGRNNVKVYHGDANVILPRDVFPEVQYSQYRRALCILDPYGLDLDWAVMKAAGELGSTEIFLNFPVMDINRNVLWHDFDRVDESRRARLTRFWGDESWEDAAYSGAGNLFGYPEKMPNATIAEAFRKRLKDVARFKFVPEPIPMRNTLGATVYYLYFAAQQTIASNIVTQIFNKYRNVGESNG